MPKKISKKGLIMLIVLSILSILIHIESIDLFKQTIGDNYMTLFIIIVPGYLLIGIFRIIISFVIKLRNLFMIQDIVFAILILKAFGTGTNKTAMDIGSLASVAFMIFSIASIGYYLFQFKDNNKQ